MAKGYGSADTIAILSSKVLLDVNCVCMSPVKRGIALPYVSDPYILYQMTLPESAKSDSLGKVLNPAWIEGMMHIIPPEDSDNLRVTWTMALMAPWLVPLAGSSDLKVAMAIS